MSPFISLLVVVVLLYAIDSWMALPANSVIFRSELGGRFRVFSAQRGGLRVRGGLYLVRAPLVPWGRLVVTALPPCQVTTLGLRPSPPFALPPLPSPDPSAELPLDSVATASSDGMSLRLGSTRIRLVAPGLAQHLGRILRRLGRARPELQRRWSERAQGPLPVDTCTVHRLRMFLLHSLELRTACTLFTLYVFGMLGLWSVKVFPLRLVTVGAIYALLLGAIQIFHWQLHRRYFPAQRGQRWLRTVLMLVSPAEAMTAVHGLGRELVAGTSPLVVARVLLDPAARADLAAQMLRAVRADAGADSALSAEHTLRARQCGLDPDTLLATPDALRDAPAHCPRCLETYTLGATTCTGCPGVELVGAGGRTGSRSRR